MNPTELSSIVFLAAAHCLAENKNQLTIIKVANIKTDLSIGSPLASGGQGLIYNDKDDSEYVWKQFIYATSDDDLKSAVIPEYNYFKKYYGEDSAFLFKYNDQIYMKMLKIPGKSLLECHADELPENKEQLLLAMLARLTDLNIYHIDLHKGNILYCSKTNMFYPIDFTTIETRYSYETDAERLKQSMLLLSLDELKKELFDA